MSVVFVQIIFGRMMIWIINFFFFVDLVILRMEMKSFLGSRGPLSWRSWWPLTVTVNLWISTLLLSCLMAVVSVLNRLQMRFRSLALYLFKSIPLFELFLFLKRKISIYYSLIWKKEMRSMRCSIRPVVLLFANGLYMLCF